MGDVDLFAGLSDPSPVSSAAAAEPALAPRTCPSEQSGQMAQPIGHLAGEKPWPPVRDGGYCEPYGPPAEKVEPEGRRLRCREPSAAVDCLKPAVASCARCLDHLRPGDLLDYADTYAIASILYYNGAPESYMTDAQFDGLCSALLGARAWRVVPWLEEGMLKAGSGYDLKKFPPELHEAAREWLESDG